MGEPVRASRARWIERARRLRTRGRPARMRGRVRGSEGWDVDRRGGGNAAIEAAAGWTAGTTSPSGWKARRKGAPHMRHSSAVVENLRFRLDEGAGCQGGS